MDKTYYQFVEFHSPVFSMGKNFGTKIHARDGVELFYDPSIPNARMCMNYKGELTVFDSYHAAHVKREEAKKPGRPKVA